MQLKLTFLLAAAAMFAQQAEITDVLDLAKAARERTASVRSGGSGGLVGVEGMIRPKLPLSLNLLSISSASARYGDSFTYEVLLKNEGTMNITIPWHSEWIEPTKQNLVVSGIVSLLFRDGFGHEHFMGAMGFHGASDAPSSIKILKPEEAVIIRASGLFAISNSNEFDSIIASLPRMIDFKAGLIFVHEGGRLDSSFTPDLIRYPLPLESGNSVAVRLQPPRNQ
jgi:hypothetical protein